MHLVLVHRLAHRSEIESEKFKAVVKVRGWGVGGGLSPPCSDLSPCNSMSPLIESIKCYFMPK